MPVDAAPPLPATVRRFVASTRIFHWLTGTLFLVLLLSGLALSLPALKAPAAGGYRLVPLLHVLAGIGFLAAPVLSLLLPRRRALLQDITAALTPVHRDLAWLRYAAFALLGARLRGPRTGKYNAGQKLNSWYFVLASLALAATGVVLGINFFTKRVFSAAFVEAVYPFHEVIALLSLLPLAGHLYLALANRATRPALAGMVTGEVDAAWAREHHAAWYEDQARV